MKAFTFLILFLLCCTLQVTAQWNKDGKIAEDTPNRKSLNGFGGHLIVVKDPQGIYTRMVETKPPKIESAEKIDTGETFGVLVLFAGCKQDSEGICNTEVDYTIYKPDGSVHAERKKQPPVEGKGPSTGQRSIGSSNSCNAVN